MVIFLNRYKVLPWVHLCLSFIVADFCMKSFGKRALEHAPNPPQQITLYRRYVDDTLVVWRKIPESQV